MTGSPFLRINEESLIIVDAFMDDEKAFFALDTGASQTVIDLNLLLILGYDLSQAIRLDRFETASGVMQAHIFRVRELRALGLVCTDFEICAFDFLERGLASEFLGLLGLDFFEGQKLCIDFRLSEITVG